MFGIASSRPTRRGTYVRGTVRCPKCATAIHIYKVTDVTDEFSLHCGACGHRRFYLKREMGVEQFLDRRSKPRAA